MSDEEYYEATQTSEYRAIADYIADLIAAGPDNEVTLNTDGDGDLEYDIMAPSLVVFRVKYGGRELAVVVGSPEDHCNL